MPDSVKQLQARIAMLEHELEITLADLHETQPAGLPRYRSDRTPTQIVFDHYRRSEEQSVCFCDDDGVAIIRGVHGWYITSMRTTEDTEYDDTVYLVGGQWSNICARGWRRHYNDAVNAYRTWRNSR